MISVYCDDCDRSAQMECGTEERVPWNSAVGPWRETGTYALPDGWAPILDNVRQSRRRIAPDMLMQTMPSLGHRCPRCVRRSHEMATKPGPVLP